MTIICQKALQLQAHIMLMITRLATPLQLRRLLRVNVATNYYLIHHIRQI